MGLTCPDGGLVTVLAFAGDRTKQLATAKTDKNFDSDLFNMLPPSFCSGKFDGFSD
jgi:hypothetical protein